MSSELLKRIVSSLILLPLVICIIIYNNIIFTLFLIICLIISLYEWISMKKNKIINFVGLFFLFFTFFLAYQLRYELDENYIYFLITILICVCTDIGGYTFGKVFKGPKLTKISPNKTYSGMIGGFLLPILILQILFNLKSLNFEINLSINSVLFIFFISFFSQIGDICISYFKRKSNIKDTGKLIPGHGGLLDRIDGIIFAIPASYFIISYSLI